MSENKAKTRVRFAPSPTGYLHVADIAQHYTITLLQSKMKER